MTKVEVPGLPKSGDKADGLCAGCHARGEMTWYRYERHLQLWCEICTQWLFKVNKLKMQDKRLFGVETKAKFVSVCVKCRRRLEKGDPLRWDPVSNRVLCMDCPVPTSR